MLKNDLNVINILIKKLVDFYFFTFIIFMKTAFWGGWIIFLLTQKVKIMSITKEKKEEIIKQYALKDGDTGSVEVQVAVLTERIKNLTEHFKSHKKDVSSRRGLLILVARRKRLLVYLKRTSEERYKKLIASLNLKK